MFFVTTDYKVIITSFGVLHLTGFAVDHYEHVCVGEQKWKLTLKPTRCKLGDTLQLATEAPSLLFVIFITVVQNAQ